MVREAEPGMQLVGEPFVISVRGEHTVVQVALGQYLEGGVAVRLYCADATCERVERAITGVSARKLATTNPGEPYATLSVKVLGVQLTPTEFVVHHDISSALRAALVKHFRDTGRIANYGFVVNRPIWDCGQLCAESAKEGAQ